MTGIEKAPMFEMERVLAGEQEFVSGKVYTFRCPTCRKHFQTDEPGEPMCTGPSESRDEHPSKMMVLFSVYNHDKVEKRPDDVTAAKRAKGGLWVPPSA